MPMKNNLLASIALFGIYRNKNLNTYDLVRPRRHR